MGTLQLIERAEKLFNSKPKIKPAGSIPDIIDLGKSVFGSSWRNGKHIDLLNKVLHEVIDGKIKRLAIMMPPRHAKTTMACQLFTPIYLAKNPDKRIIYTTYQADKAAEWGRKSRDIIEQFGNLLGIQTRQDSRSASKWDISGRRGGMLTAGVGGPLVGSGADCFPAGTMVTTEYGQIDIAHLYQLIDHVRVLSFNHAIGAFEWKQVLAKRKITRHGLIEVTTKSGRMYRSTAEHPVYVKERGYVASSLLSEGDKIIVASFEKQQGLPCVQETKDWAWCDVQAMLREDTCGRWVDSADMQLLPNGIHQTQVRCKQGYSQRDEGQLLFSKMFREPSCNQEQKEMFSMQCPGCQEDPKVLRELQNGEMLSQIRTKEMPSMPMYISPVSSRHGLLQPEMCRRYTFKGDGWGWESKIYSRQQLSGVISEDEEVYQGKGWHEVCSLQGCIKVASASCGRGQAQQCAREFNNALWNMPCTAPQIQEDTISVVKYVCDSENEVYDIQVEGNHNFFANEILVHNCLIIDDAHKNNEEVDSPVMREKLVDWFSSTALTRLEPGGAVVMIMHRWRRDDLMGWALSEAKKNGEEWTVLKLPVLADGEDILGRKPGEVLWPERFSQQEMEERKRTTAPRWWFSLYQQDPQLEEGAEWPADWFTDVWVDDFPKPNDCQIKVLSLDPSKGKTDKRGDYSAYVMLVRGKDGLVYVGADMCNRRHAEKIVHDGLQLILKHRPDAFVIESNASQDLFGLLFQNESRIQQIHIRFDRESTIDGPVFCKEEHYQSKVGRIRSWGEWFGRREVRFVRSMPQTQLLLDQFMAFPTGGNDPGVDDGPDSAAMALKTALEISYHPELLRSR